MTTEERLARVERQCMMFKAGFALVTVALAVVLLIGASQDQDKTKVLEEVRAKRFVLLDEAGKDRGGLATTKDGPGLVLWNENGKPSVNLIAERLGASLALSDKTGTRRLNLDTSAGGTVLALADENGADRAGFVVTNFASVLMLSDRNGKLRALLDSAEDGASLQLADSGGANLGFYVFNPYDSSSYTFTTSQMAGKNTSDFNAGKYIGVHKVAETIRGFQLYESNAARTFGGGQINVYGLASN